MVESLSSAKARTPLTCSCVFTRLGMLGTRGAQRALGRPSCHVPEPLTTSAHPIQRSTRGDLLRAPRSALRAAVMEMLRGATHTLAALESGVPCPERCACALTVRDAAQQLARVGASHGLRHLLNSLKQLQRALEQLALLGARLHVPDVCASLRACAASAPHSALPSICSCLASIHCDPALPHILRSASSLAPLLPRSPESAPSLAPCIPNRELPPS
jgi:hypothetical protein